MLNRDFPLGLARHHGQIGSSYNPKPSGSTSATLSRRAASKMPHTQPPDGQPNENGALPEDVVVIILGHLHVADLLVVRRCSKWFKHLTENRQIWIKFVSHPYFPSPASAFATDAVSTQELEQLVRRQFELSRTWSPKRSVTSPIAVHRSYRLPMPNNESLTAMSSMDSWVAVASDLGGVYVCAPFGWHIGRSTKWVRMLSVPVEINKLSVAVWHSSGREYVAVMWAGRLFVGLEYQCGLVVALAEDLVAAQGRAPGRIVLSTSDFVLSSMIQLRNPASEIMDITLGDRYCAVVDAAHIIQTISIQFLPNNQLLFQSDSFIAVYKPISPDSTDMRSKYTTKLPSTHFFGLLTQRRSSNVPYVSDYMSVPLLALGSNGAEVTHFDLRVAPDDDTSDSDGDYGLSHRRSASYLLVPWMKPFSLGTINGGHSRLVWITSAQGRPFGIALGRFCIDNGDPVLSYQAQLNRAELDLGQYGEALIEHAPSGPLFAFHEGEGKLLGGIRGVPELFMMEY